MGAHCDVARRSDRLGCSDIRVAIVHARADVLTPIPRPLHTRVYIGKTTRTTNLPSSSAPFSHAATLHNAHAASTTLALLTADSSTGALTAAQLVPHHADSQASSRTHFVAHVTYDALADSDVIEAVALNEGGGGPPVPVWRAPLGECSSRDHGMRVLAFSKVRRPESASPQNSSYLANSSAPLLFILAHLSLLSVLLMAVPVQRSAAMMGFC